MPALQLCSHRWAIAADDLAIPSACAAGTRSVWLVLTIAILVALRRAIWSCASESNDGNGSVPPAAATEIGSDLELVNLFVTLTLATSLAGLFLCASVFMTSLQGTITDVSARRKMPKLLCALAATTTLQIPLAILGTYIIFAIRSDELVICTDPSSLLPDSIAFDDTTEPINLSLAWLALQFVVLTCWLDVLLISGCSWLTMLDHVKDDYLNELSIDVTSETVGIMRTPSPGIPTTLEATGETWERRCRLGCMCAQIVTCNLFGGVGNVNSDVFNDVAIVMARFFKGLELVPSDLVASLLLLRAEQKEEERLAIEEVQLFRSGRHHHDHAPNRRRARTFSSQDPRDFTSRPTSSSPSHGMHGSSLRASVQDWLWGNKGVLYRAQSRLHIQNVREARSALQRRGESSFSSLHQNSEIVSNLEIQGHVLDSDRSELLRNHCQSYGVAPNLEIQEQQVLNHGVTNTAPQHNGVEGAGMNTNCHRSLMRVDANAVSILKDAAYFGEFMLGIYGWMLFSYMQPHTGICQLCCSPQATTATPSPSSFPLCACLGGRGVGTNISDPSSCCSTSSMDYRALRHKTGLRDEDIVYTSFTSYCGKSIPFCVAVDHVKKTVVLSCRGTLSMADLLTDVLLAPVQLMPYAERWGFVDMVDENSSAHSGMTRVAAWIREDLARTQVLEGLFGLLHSNDQHHHQNWAATSTSTHTPPSPSSRRRKSVDTGAETTATAATARVDTGEAIAPLLWTAQAETPLDDLVNGSQANIRAQGHFVLDVADGESNGVDNGSIGGGDTGHHGVGTVRVASLPDCHDYEFVVLGHSLGAGVASILSLMLRPSFPRLRCIAFSPPGCIFDRQLADASTAWISSPFVGKDMVPRSSWHNVVKLRGQMLDVLRRSKVNKNKALRSAIMNVNARDLLWDEDQVPDTAISRDLRDHVEALARHQPSHPLNLIPLFPPGRLLHLSKVETTEEGYVCCPSIVCGKKQQRYEPMWVDDRGCLDEFLVSRRMALDHFPDYVDKVIKAVADEWTERSEADGQLAEEMHLNVAERAV